MLRHADFPASPFSCTPAVAALMSGLQKSLPPLAFFHGGHLRRLREIVHHRKTRN